MKLKSLILGSVAAAGLSTAGYAADLGVLTSLDVCDSLGISGLTISSSDNCLQISGKVTYEFNYGDYAGNAWLVNSHIGTLGILDNNGTGSLTQDWSSDVDSWLKFVGTASSDFGPASATIKLKNESKTVVVNEVVTSAASNLVEIDEAFVSIGDTTTIMAGKKGSIANVGDDEPLNWLALFNSEIVDKGVGSVYGGKADGHAIQIVSDLGNGVKVKAGLEALEKTAADAGNLIGVIEYAGEGIKAHVTAGANGILDGDVNAWWVHAGFDGTFDAFRIVGAGAYGALANGDNSWNVLASAQAKFDMFTIALSGEALGGQVGGVARPGQVGVGGSVGATVTEGVTINVGARWFDENTSTSNNETYQVAAELAYAVSETITVKGEVGYFHTSEVVAEPHDVYGKATLEWKPGGGFESTLAAQAHSTGAYKVTFKAAKEFK
ncbi:hypothetical protein [Devosia sediminis]|uniref:Porin n=1 Tax=Devosia sediminis TaxID=2798801 RepID=A0A934IUI9_9HYPH|nr:hypothetical protein [Devosia sediminis]MBJ3785391.1 hypothetical protein [Devosia sediminis]